MATMDKLEQIQQTLSKIDPRVPDALRAALHIGDRSSPVPAPLAIFAASVLPPPAAADPDDDEAVVPGELDDVSLAQQQHGEEEEAEPSEPALGIRYGSCYLPLHDDDAHFVHAESGAFGVADGVGGYARLGVDAGAFARGLMANALAAAAETGGEPVRPHALLQAAHERTAASRASGASTAVILSLAGRTLEWAYIGDSSFAVLRGGRVVCRSKPQQHFFNAPLRLSADPQFCDDVVTAARTGRMGAREGDVVVVGTDGLFDNVTGEQLERVVRMGARLRFSAKNMADVIAGIAFEASKRTLVGKPDDITVVVAFVVQPDL
ncbi:hypothetical protein PR202_ga02072 [Eleusine coracana subsp. coracana]|uniref:Protein phosphatase n=1 Tax=Eleusine coracana subsp. coracana TaxID=191504 RepID=A0AAV5BGQ3_ELECO|nr:hypothetical protein PR202_ga01385 [Eleusine coracana subsp. coracana]GJM86231.1 hypothetical protein PR202_ga02072 [Eleusine coracana subsp. coracana]